MQSEYHPAMPTDLMLVLIIVLVVVVLWRGPKTLPRLGEALGRGLREAKRGARDESDDTVQTSGDDPERRS
jgi:TatA/E family protein of Tat protein translocase